MRTTLTIILILIGFLTFGQENKLGEDGSLINKIEPDILDSLYVKALNNRIDLLLQSGWHYVEMNEYGSRIKNLIVPDRYKFLTTDELIDLSIKEKRTINVLRIVHNIISKDTVDINFSYIGFTGKRKLHFCRGIRLKKTEITVGCGGINGYQPDIRFAFDSLINEWKIIKNRFVKTNGE
ncbi:hypothetical protein [Runella sp. CRIBMP]|uniref:hypothetical protein n=1 Tax=Runella sp. CRIBMP TaxID=2683261 RepID=UPI00197EB5A5|nr:hypothetical protein [Runella sp. CRIBMP]